MDLKLESKIERINVILESLIVASLLPLIFSFIPYGDNYFISSSHKIKILLPYFILGITIYFIIFYKKIFNLKQTLKHNGTKRNK